MATKTNEERAAEVDALHEQLNTAIASLVSADGWKAMLCATVANLGRYSASNMLLILAQCPHATQVRSFKQWKEHGRSVRKGEKGLRIFAPMTVKKKDDTGAPVLDENGQEQKRTIFKITLAHEGAHIECGHVADMDEYRRHRGRMECEAESVAYIVAGVAGLDAALTSVPYIADWAGRTAEEVRETLAAASATVVRAARAILATTTATPDEAAETGEAERAAEEAAHAAYQEVRAEMIETAHQREQGQPLSAAPEAAAAQE